MSKYHLTEAYGNLYNPRKADETFYENLRFVDYLMQEEIEEVMESLLWEFMDYGNTLDESYDLIESVFSDDVILEGVLMELNPYAPAGSREARQYAASTRRSKRGAERAAKITGALKAAKETVGKIATGVRDAAVGGYRGAKRMAGTAYTAARQGAGEAKAGLQKLVRKGAMAAGSKGRAMEKAGKAAEESGLKYTTITTRGGVQVGEPKVKTSSGGKRQAIGRLLRKAGAMVGRAVGRGSSSGGSTSDGGGSSPAVSTVRQTRRRSSAGATSGGSRATSGDSTTTRPRMGGGTYSSGALRSPASDNSRSSRTTRRRSSAVSSQTSTSTPTRRRKPKRTSFLTSQREKLAAQRSQAQRSQTEEFELLAQYIMEDFINEGYADTYEEALEILENLSESSIVELTEMYLEG